MEHLPPAGWSHLASKDDLALTTGVLRTEMADLRTELKQEMADLRAELKQEIADLRTELKQEIADLRAELKQDMAQLRIDMERGFRSQTWKMITAIGASQAVSVAIMAAMVNSLR